MKYRDLDIYWKRIFELNWESLCKGSKAISMYSKSGYFKVSKAQGL